MLQSKYGAIGLYDADQPNGIKECEYEVYHNSDDGVRYYKKIIKLNDYEYLAYTMSEEDHRDFYFKRDSKRDYLRSLKEWTDTQ